MIYIKIELWPFGDSSKRKTLGEMFIWNTGDGTPERGNYKFWWGKKKENSRELMEVRVKKREPKGELKDFPRKSYDVFELIRRCLNAEKIL